MDIGGSGACPRAPLVRALSFHGQYRCHNTGVCCSSGWDVAVEEEVEVRLTPLLALSPRSLPNGADGFRPVSDPPSGCRSSLRIASSGACWFRDEPGQACAIHRDHGEEALPSACRQFPRVCVLEPDAVSVSLSHYCPTAAGLLFEGPAQFGLVTSPRAFPNDWPYEGLDARDAYPPFLRPGVLLGFDGLRAFEDRAVAVLSREPLWEALAIIDSAAARARSWAAAHHGALAELIPGFFEPSDDAGARSTDPRPVLLAAMTEGTQPRDGLPDYRPAAPAPSGLVDLALRKYLAARLIAAWITFQGEGLSSVTRFLHLCLDTVFLFESARGATEAEEVRWKEAIRNADLWILHYSDPDRLARILR